MQNPFRHRPQDDFGRRERDDGRWEARDRRYDESSSWSEGDGGRTADAYLQQGSGQYARDRDATSAEQARDRGSPRWAGYEQPTAEYRRADQGRSDYTRGDYGDYYGVQGRYDRSGYGPSQDYERQTSRSRTEDDFGYRGQQQTDYGRFSAPGSEIWDGPGKDVARHNHHASRHDFEPDYLHWREQQLSGFDRDYHDWRSERREKFSADFDNWRSSRPQVQAENPIVGDVTDGGTGDASEVKKR
ncbi:hypothetical protein GCM10009422_15790 [Brevundimonas kwangchunensis]|uniref:SWFGD domain-containing protein n=1 Tax=Brevundimonas kwangchunensis TaxID=322163 RepID=A0ABN1GVI3_9CAUL